MNVTDRFLKYVSFCTQSSENSEAVPSTPGQKVLGKALVRELAEMGLDARMDENGTVYGEIPASGGLEQEPVIGLIAHMDTSPSASGENVRPEIIKDYNGGDIVLNREPNIVMRPCEYPSLNDNRGKDLIVTDGTTLLGADDKAGVAEIMSLAQRLAESSDIPHGTVKLAFTPDEEIGKGTDHFDIDGFGADFAYTVDGGPLGELEYENFNAASAAFTIHGISIHPGEAKNKMKNACLVACELISMMPPAETPAATEGYEGFYHLASMAGNEEKAVLKFLVRDHSMEKFQARKQFLTRLTAYLNDKYGGGTVDLALRDSYYNMKEKLEPHMFIIDRAKSAMEAEGVTPVITPVRGGTDGARLSWEGLPCPNLSTGGYNFHGRFEYIPVQSLGKMVDVLIRLVRADQPLSRSIAAV